VTGGDGYEPCAPLAPGAQECTLQYFADKGIADQVVPPVITMKDFEKVLERARPTVSVKDLEVCVCVVWGQEERGMCRCTGLRGLRGRQFGSVELAQQQ
jgi:hypothetical protein